MNLDDFPYSEHNSRVYDPKKLGFELDVEINEYVPGEERDLENSIRRLKAYSERQ